MTVSATDDTKLDPKEFRQALGCFATGVAVVTTLETDGDPIGLTINSFNSVSLDPPLILWSLALEAPSHGAFSRAPSFAVNVLAEHQLDLCQQFARPSDDKFEGVSWQSGADGAPLLTDAIAHFECRTYRAYDGGDHTIFLGRVHRVRSHPGRPLIFHRGSFAELET